MTKIIHKQLSYDVGRVLRDIHKELGPGLPEKFYQKAVTYGLQKQGIACIPEKQFEVFYRGILAGRYYVDHWVGDGKIILELKVAPEIEGVHKAQAISYLKVTNADVAIVVNFGTEWLQDKRFPNFVRDKVVDFQWKPRFPKNNMLYPELSNRLFEVLHRVHFTLGPGFIHRVYRQATRIELRLQGLQHEYINEIPIYYDGQLLGVQKIYIVKVENKILLGIFAVKAIDEPMKATMKARLKHLGVKLGFLVNFYGERLVIVPVRRMDEE